MLFTIIKNASKITSIVLTAKAGYDVYKKGVVIYKAYKTVQNIGKKTGAAKGIGAVNTTLKKLKNKNTK